MISVWGDVTTADRFSVCHTLDGVSFMSTVKASAAAAGGLILWGRIS